MLYIEYVIWQKPLKTNTVNFSYAVSQVQSAFWTVQFELGGGNDGYGR